MNEDTEVVETHAIHALAASFENIGSQSESLTGGGEHRDQQSCPDVIESRWVRCPASRGDVSWSVETYPAGRLWISSRIRTCQFFVNSKVNKSKKLGYPYSTRMRGASCSHSNTHCCMTRRDLSSAPSKDASVGKAEDDGIDVERSVDDPLCVLGYATGVDSTGLTVTSSLSTLKGRPKLKLQRLC